MVLVRRVLLSGCCLAQVFLGSAVAILGATGPALSSALAESKVMLEIPVYGEAAPADLRRQAESMAAAAIQRQFAQAVGADRVEVVVSANRNGEIVPLLTVSVARPQWESAPEVNRWAQHYDVSYGLVLRHGPVELAAAPVAQSGTTAGNPASRGRPRTSRPVAARNGGYSTQQIEAAQDGRFLPGKVAQDYLSDLD